MISEPWEVDLSGSVLFYNCTYIPDCIWTKIDIHSPAHRNGIILTNRLVEVHNSDGIEVKIGYYNRPDNGYDGMIEKGRYYFPYQDGTIYNNHAIRLQTLVGQTLAGQALASQRNDDIQCNISVYEASDMNALDQKRFQNLSLYQPIVFDSIHLTKCHTQDLDMDEHLVSYIKSAMHPFNLEQHGKSISNNYPKIDFMNIHTFDKWTEKTIYPTWFEKWFLWEKPYTYNAVQYRYTTESEATCNKSIFMAEYIDSGLLYLVDT